MSIPVALVALRAAVEERGATAYLITVSASGAPHLVHVALTWEGDALAAEVGKRTAANAAAHPAVSLLFPVRSPDDYSLIVDGAASVAGPPGAQRLLIAPTTAVQHRPAVSPDPAASCGHDCVPVLAAPPRR